VRTGRGNCPRRHHLESTWPMSEFVNEWNGLLATCVPHLRSAHLILDNRTWLSIRRTSPMCASGHRSTAARTDRCHVMVLLRRPCDLSDRWPAPGSWDRTTRHGRPVGERRRWSHHSRVIRRPDTRHISCRRDRGRDFSLEAPAYESRSLHGQRSRRSRSQFAVVAAAS